jgi:hypothetical protein
VSPFLGEERSRGGEEEEEEEKRREEDPSLSRLGQPGGEGEPPPGGRWTGTRHPIKQCCTDSLASASS